MHSSALGADLLFMGACRTVFRVMERLSLASKSGKPGKFGPGLGLAWRTISVLVWEFARLHTVCPSRPLLAANNPTKVDIQTDQRCIHCSMHSPKLSNWCHAK